MNSVLFATALTMGVLGGAHCIVMCGGVVGVLCGGLPSELRGRPRAQLPFLLAYNAGRVASYAMAGALAGGFGAAADRLDAAFGVRVALRLIAGLLMLGAGLFLAGALPRFAAIERVGGPLWRFVQPLTAKVVPIRSPLSALALGALWGFLPCGLSYAALGLALATGSPGSGALTMGAFGLGTVPALLASGLLASSIARAAARGWLRRSAGIAMAIFGLVNVATVSAQASWFHLPGAAPTCCAHHGKSAQ